MKKLLYKKIDAFIQGSSLGNPAGVVYLPQGMQITDSQMLDIARQEKGIVSEVVICSPEKEGCYNLKYYSSECEVEFCGHGTIACMYDLITTNACLNEVDTIMIKTVKGELPVYNVIKDSDSVFVTAPIPEYLPCSLTRPVTSENLGITAEAIDEGLPIAIINGGLRTLIVPISSFTLIMNLKPDIEKLKEFCIANDIDIILVFSQEVFDSKSLYRTRVFAPRYGYLEDPATGSGNSAFGYYLLQREIWKGDGIISLEQGPSSDSPNVIRLTTRCLNGVQRIIFGGKAAVQYEKEISVED